MAISVSGSGWNDLPGGASCSAQGSESTERASFKRGDF